MFTLSILIYIHILHFYSVDANECGLKSTKYNVSYDLSELKQSEEYIVDDDRGIYSFSFNICQRLTNWPKVLIQQTTCNDSESYYCNDLSRNSCPVINRVYNSSFPYAVQFDPTGNDCNKLSSPNGVSYSLLLHKDPAYGIKTTYSFGKWRGCGGNSIWNSRNRELTIDAVCTTHNNINKPIYDNVYEGTPSCRYNLVYKSKYE